MSRITRCPSCATLFKVVPDQLRISGGWVRCGHCNQIFDATRHMASESGPLPAADAQGPQQAPPSVAAPGPTQMHGATGKSQAVPSATPRRPTPASPASSPSSAVQSAAQEVVGDDRVGATQVLSQTSPRTPISSPPPATPRSFFPATDLARADEAGTRIPDMASLLRHPVQDGVAQDWTPSELQNMLRVKAAWAKRQAEVAQVLPPAADRPAVPGGTAAVPKAPKTPSSDKAASSAPSPTPSSTLPPVSAPASPNRAVVTRQNVTDWAALDALDAAARGASLSDSPTSGVRHGAEQIAPATAPVNASLAPMPDGVPVDFLLSDIGRAPPGDDGRDASDTRGDGALAAVSTPVTGRSKVKSSRRGKARRDDAHHRRPAPSFVAAARQRAFWASPKVRLYSWLAVALLALALALQVALTQRDALAARAPGLAPALRALCQPFGCQLQPYRQLDAIVIDSSAFIRVDAHTFHLSYTLRNRFDMPVATPALELTLRDASEQPVLRRVLRPAELGAPQALAARSEFNGLSQLVAGTAVQPESITGYDLVAFYP